MVLVCALFAAFLFAPQQDYIAEGLKALDASQPAGAEALFRRAVEADANDFAAHFNLALALSLQARDAEAIQELRRTLELKPGLYQAEINLGTLLLRNQRAAEAMPILREAAAAPADTPARSARAWLLYAQALDQTGETAQAAEYYSRTIEADGASAAGHSGLGHDDLKLGRLAEAAVHLRQAAGLDRQYRDGLLELAGAYEKSGKASEAMEIYREFPGDARARERLTQLLVESGKSAAAIPTLETAVKQSPNTENRLGLADAYKLNKQTDKAIEQLELAAHADPANFDIHMALGRELRDQRKFVDAAQQFAAAAKLRPDSDKAWNELAAVLVVSEDYGGGLAALDRVRALGKEVPGDFYYRAISLEKLRQPKPAMEAYRQFLAADGGKMPDQEFLARQRVRIIENELNRK